MIGFRVLKRKRAVSRAWAQKYATLPVANISDSMSRLTAGGTSLRPMHKEGVLSGPALTVKTRPGDNLMLHKALNIAQEGDVVVVDAGGDLTNAMIGELMISYAITRKVAGIVIYGAVRDSAWIKAHDFPIYACGVTHRGPYKDGPGEINVPIAIEGMVITPGDLIVGDEDGVLCVPYEDVEMLYEKTAAKHEAENKQMAAILAGTSDRSWIDASLAKLGCFIEE